MKRGGPLARRTPLVARTPLVSRTPLHRGGPLRPTSAKRDRQFRVRVIAEQNLGRAGLYGTCARCGVYTYVNGHERIGRAQGGDPSRPDCLLCVGCNTWCEDNPKLAAWSGWKVSNKHPHDHTLENGQARDLDGNVVIFAAYADESEVAS